MNIYQYKFKLGHDKGKIVIKTTGTNLVQAIKNIVQNEGAPMGAISSITIKKIN